MKKNQNQNPPRWADRFLGWFCKDELLESIQGDLIEIFQDDLQTKTIRKAKWKYIKSVFGLARPGIIKHFQIPFLISKAMFKNYFKVATRQILKHKLFTTLNVLGLATSMSVCLLIIMILVDQYSFDQFHTNKDNIYRVLSGLTTNEANTHALKIKHATAPLPLAKEIKENNPWVKDAVQIARVFHLEIKTDEKKLQRKGLWTDPNFFNVFSFDWKEGDQQKALLEPNSIVLTENLATDFFGEKDPMGQIIKISDWGDFIVKGIMRNPPNRTHIKFDYLISLSTLPRLEREEKISPILNNWNRINAGYVYLLLEDGTSKNILDAKIAALADKQNQLSEKYTFGFLAQSINNITPGSIRVNTMGPTVPLLFLYFLGTLSFLIMLTACFNFTNLSIARSLKRAKEIGIRKVSGAKRSQIIIQFLIEAILISILAVILSSFLMEFIIPAFYSLDPEIDTVFFLERSPQLYLIFLGFSVLIGLIAGLIPALHISSFEPIQVLKKLTNVKLFSRVGLRKILIVIQFSLSLLFILGTIIILQQQKHVLGVDLGIRTDNIVNVNLETVDYSVFAKELEAIHGVNSVSGAWMIPATGRSSTLIVNDITSGDSIQIYQNYVSQNYPKEMGLEIIAGHSFLNDASSEHIVLINKAAAKELGYTNPSDAIGHALQPEGWAGKKSALASLTIVGVIKDFHFRRVGHPIEAYCLRLSASENISYAVLNIKGEDIRNTIQEVQTAWAKVNSNIPFTYSFYDEAIAQSYAELNVFSSILGFVAFIAIIIAIMGLLGMVIYAVEGRQKEIGIRKVLGASEMGLTWLLSRGFFILLGIATLIATPLAIFFGNMWLQNYRVRVFIGPKIILLGVGSILLLGLIVVISQTYWAARANPVDRLRSE